MYGNVINLRIGKKKVLLIVYTRVYKTFRNLNINEVWIVILAIGVPYVNSCSLFCQQHVVLNSIT